LHKHKRTNVHALALGVVGLLQTSGVGKRYDVRTAGSWGPRLRFFCFFLLYLRVVWRKPAFQKRFPLSKKEERQAPSPAFKKAFACQSRGAESQSNRVKILVLDSTATCNKHPRYDACSSSHSDHTPTARLAPSTRIEEKETSLPEAGVCLWWQRCLVVCATSCASRIVGRAGLGSRASGGYSSFAFAVRLERGGASDCQTRNP